MLYRQRRIISAQSSKRTKGLLVHIVKRQGIHQTNVGAMKNKNLMESVKISISMGIEKVSAQKKKSLNVNVSIAINNDINLQNIRQRKGTQHNKL